MTDSFTYGKFKETLMKIRLKKYFVILMALLFTIIVLSNIEKHGGMKNCMIQLIG